ncbi:hypothetical protein J3R30DRAFT_31357 [Lentinula aciculospora]|uniref:Secreted protein n=1 Tax=Lentinula aciculospora TaxID=153920 RepID=A0A9W9ATC7_9AGAR|nr:hypothetical protein J3R30DRAFT_31357 [Lentinula aciculospora]
MRPFTSLFLLVLLPNPPQLIPVLGTVSNCIILCLSSSRLSIRNTMCRIPPRHLNVFRRGFQDLNHGELLFGVTAAVQGLHRHHGCVLGGCASDRTDGLDVSETVFRFFEEGSGIVYRSGDRTSPV